MTNIIARTITKIVIPATPRKAKILSFYIFFTKVKGISNKEITTTIKAG